LIVESEEEVTDAVGEAVATDGPVEISADGSVSDVAALEDDALAPEESLDPEAATAADPDAELPGEPDEVDLDETDGPPTPGA
jgi:hypothetical protein